jgi:sugar phosphate permease
MRVFRWTAFTLVVLAYMLAFFHRTAPAALAEELSRAFSASATSLGALAAAYFYVYTVMQIPTGVLVDTYGPRRTVALGMGIAGLGSIVFGWADSLWQAWLGRMLVGFGVAFPFLSILKLYAEWFREREFATMVGVTMLLGNAAAVLSATPLSWLIELTSWRNVFAVIGVFSFVLAVLTWIMVSDKPGDAGLPSMSELEGKDAHPPHEGHWYEGLKQVLKNRETWSGFWITLGAGGALLTFAGLWGVPYFMDVHGYSRTTAANHTSLVLAGFALGALFSGYLSDRLGLRRPLIVASLFIYSASWLPWVLNVAMPTGASYALSALTGLSAGGFTVSWACAKELNPPALSGMATSVVNTGIFLGTGILQPVFGWILDRGSRAADDYRIGLALLFACSVFSLAAAFFMRETHCRNVWIVDRKSDE